MRGARVVETDCLIVGSGLAGSRAALAAAEKGIRVLVVSQGKTFSGSSFYPGTWGFGLVGPEEEEDVENFVETILDVGKNIPERRLVQAFVEAINPTVDELESRGLELLKPTPGHEKDSTYIPCFDRKHRRWRGLTKEKVKAFFQREFERNKIKTFEDTEILELSENEGRITGAFGRSLNNELLYFSASSVILATGGLGGLYRHKLTTTDVLGTGLGLALRHQARGINTEFMQIMLGFSRPAPKTIFNEKTYEAAGFRNGEGERVIPMLLPEGITEDAVLHARSQHGPFTASRLGKYVDLALFRASMKSPEQAVHLQYDLEKLEHQEFTKVYFDWLKREKGVSPEEDIQVRLYMHASNGGIAIDEKAYTGVPGLYAAGECTGGMHGADRIGGLATASALVFGKIAGEEAAKMGRNRGKTPSPELLGLRIPQAQERRRILQEKMSEDAFLLREEKALNTLEETLKTWEGEAVEEPNLTVSEAAESLRLVNLMASARHVLKAMAQRPHSLGSHYREDDPGDLKGEKDDYR